MVGASSAVGATPPDRSDAVPVAPRSLARNSTAVFLAGLAVQLVGFVASLFLAKLIGLTESGRALLGTVQLFLLIGSSINATADLRIGSAYTFFLARGTSPLAQTATYLVLRFVMVGAGAVLLFVIAPAQIFGAGPLASGANLAILGGFLVLPLLWTFPTVYNQFYISQGDSLKAQYPTLIEASVRTPLLIAAAFYVPTLEGLTLAYVVGATVSAVYSAPAVLARVEKFRRDQGALMFRFAWPLMGGLALTYVVTNALPFLVNAAAGAAQLAVYNAANGFRILALSVSSAIITPLFPLLSGLHQRREYNRVRELTWQTIRYSSIVVVPGMIALVVYRVNFLYIFYNGGYVGGATPLAILAVSVLPATLAVIIFTALIAVGYRRLELYITAAQVVAMFGTAYLLLPPVSLLPAGLALDSIALAQLASSLVALAINLYYLERILAVQIRLRSIGSIVLSAAVAFFAVSRLNVILPVNRYYQLFAGVVLGYAVYFVVLAAIGELSRSDVESVGRSVGVPWRIRRILARVCWRTDPSIVVVPLEAERLPRLRQTELPDVFSGVRELPTLAPLSSEPGEMRERPRAPP